MSELHLRPSFESRPFIAALCIVPLVGEAVAAALDFAEVRTFIGRRDTAGLLAWLQPDGAVVDNADDAAAASDWAEATGRALVHLDVRARTLSVFRSGAWVAVDSDDEPTPEVIRSVVAGALFARAPGP